MKTTLINTSIFLALLGAMFLIQVADRTSYADEVAMEEMEKHRQELKMIEANSPCGNGIEDGEKCKVRRALKAGKVKP